LQLCAGLEKPTPLQFEAKHLQTPRRKPVFQPAKKLPLQPEFGAPLFTRWRGKRKPGWERWLTGFSFVCKQNQLDPCVGADL